MSPGTQQPVVNGCQFSVHFCSTYITSYLQSYITLTTPSTLSFSNIKNILILENFVINKKVSNMLTNIINLQDHNNSWWCTVILTMIYWKQKWKTNYSSKVPNLHFVTHIYYIIIHLVTCLLVYNSTRSWSSWQW